MERKAISPWPWADELGVVQGYEVTGAERFVFTAAQASTDDDGNVINEGDMGAQITRALDNLETVLAEANMTLANVIVLNYFSMDCDAFMACYETHIGPRLRAAGCRPAGMLMGAPRMGFPGLLMEVQATAVA